LCLERGRASSIWTCIFVCDIISLTIRRIQCLLALVVPPSRFTSRVGGGQLSTLGGIAWSHMKSPFTTLAVRRWLFALLVAQTAFVSGCTSVLWNKNTFAHHYQPADPSNLRLFYSKERKDILVQYDELSDTHNKTRPRSYWLGPNTIRVTKAPPNSIPPGFMELYAVAPRNDYLFTLYSGKEQLDPYQLPMYIGASRRVKQILLTPFAVAVDATIAGAVIAVIDAPWILAGLNR
jgi:hypothetical protein